MRRTLKDIHSYTRGKIIVVFFVFEGTRLSVEENTEHSNSVHVQQVSTGVPQKWQESFSKQYFRVDRVSKEIIYYGWRFGELYTFELVLFIMVLISRFTVTKWNWEKENEALLWNRFVHLMFSWWSWWRLDWSWFIFVGGSIYSIRSSRVCTFSLRLQIVKEQISQTNVFLHNCSQVTINTDVSSYGNSTCASLDNPISENSRMRMYMQQRIIRWVWSRANKNAVCFLSPVVDLRMERNRSLWLTKSRTKLGTVIVLFSYIVGSNHAWPTDPESHYFSSIFHHAQRLTNLSERSVFSDIDCGHF